jgi:excisionase family DNA binding protein
MVFNPASPGVVLSLLVYATGTDSGKIRRQMTEQQHIGVREAAQRLGVHENTVRNWAGSGLLESVRLPGSGFRRFREDDVAQLGAVLREHRLEQHRGTMTSVANRDLAKLLAVARLYLDVYAGLPPRDGLYQDVAAIVVRYGRHAEDTND